MMERLLAYQKEYNKLIFFVLFLLVTAGLMPMAVSAAEKSQNILLINSYHAGFKWTDDQTDAIIAGLSQDNQNILYVEYIDWKRYPTDSNLRQLQAYMAFKYGDQKIDLIITTDDAALHFALNQRQEIFSDAPIVFSGVFKSAADDLLQGQSNVTGVYESIDPDGTIKLARKMNPQLQNIYILYDDSESGKDSGEGIIKSIKEINDQMETNGDPLIVHDLSYLNFEAIMQKLTNPEKEDSIILMGSYSKDIDGLAYPPEIYSRLISAKSNIPMYSVYEVLFGNGIMGGSLLSGRILGEKAAMLANKILEGQAATSLAMIDEMQTFTGLDYVQLERFEMQNKPLPDNARIINQPFSFTKTYRYLIYRVAFFFLLLFGFIILLLSNINKRKRAEEALTQQNEELTALYEELIASEEELRQQFGEMVRQQGILKEHQERHQLVLEATKDSIWDWDIVLDRRVYSDKVLDILGYYGYELEKYAQWLQVIHPEDQEMIDKKIKEHLAGKTETYFSEYRILDKDQNERWIRANGKAIFDNNGNAFRMVGSHRDITELKEHQQRINYLAYYDYLTGLPNRVLLKEKMEKAILEAKAKQYQIAVLYIDLDNFKVVNDSFGHRIGDQLLITISDQLTGTLGEEAIVAKLGGDEFIVMFKEVEDKQAVIELAEKMIGLFDGAIIIEGHACYVSMSIGIVFYPENGENEEELLKNADTAMYKAKELGKRRFVMFSKEMNDIVVEKARLQINLRKAIENQEFVLHYQPQVDLLHSKITGFEALIRWYSREGQMIQPDRFIGLAEETGLIVPIGDWVLESACVFAKRLQQLGYLDMSVAVNISTVQLRQKNFVEKIIKILEKTELSPQNLELEITETVLIEFFDPHINATLTQLKNEGIRISLDDFGRGYSSLNYIRKLPISTLKIDKSFIDDIQDKYDNKSITGSIIILAHQLGLKVIAEGVEVVKQLEYLQNYRCDAIQGYIISKPLPEDQAVHILMELNTDPLTW